MCILVDVPESVVVFNACIVVITESCIHSCGRCMQRTSFYLSLGDRLLISDDERAPWGGS